MEMLDCGVCGEEDEITGAHCSLPLPHEPPHLDETDWGVIVSFREGNIPKLLVPGPGTGFSVEGDTKPYV